MATSGRSIIFVLITIVVLLTVTTTFFASEYFITSHQLKNNSNSSITLSAPSPCYNSTGYYSATNVSEYQQCVSRLLLLGYNESFGTNTFSIASGEGYPFCFGFSPCNFSTSNSGNNTTTKGTALEVPISSVGPAYLLINYNASHLTSLEIIQDVITFNTSPSLNSSFYGGNFGYSVDETTPDYNFYVPINSDLTFECLFLNNSTQFDSGIVSFAIIW